MRRIYFILFLAGLGLAACQKKEALSPPSFELYVPTAFTPDGDGVNDVFEVKGTNISKYQIDIYSPTNVLLYESFDIRHAWDGTFKGNPMPPDNYLWVIEYVNMSSEKHKSSGYVELVR